MDYTGERVISQSLPATEKNVLREHEARYRFVLAEMKKINARDFVCLDIASGSGWGSSLLYQSGFFRQVIGADVSRAAVDYAAGRYQASGLSFCQADAARLPFADQTFDLLVSFETIEHLDSVEQPAMIRELSRVLKPDGYLFISTPDREITSKLKIDNPYHRHELNLGELSALLVQDFKLCFFYGQRPFHPRQFSVGLPRKIYALVSRLGWLHLLKRIFPPGWRGFLGAKVDGLSRAYSPEPLTAGRQYLFLIALCRKK